MLFSIILLILLQSSILTKSAKLPVHRNQAASSKETAEQEIRLEDFFWTGSGDGPPEYVKRVHTSADNGKEVIVKTETVVATIYVEGQNDLDVLCLDCEHETSSLPINYTTLDRRFWLLTVVGGFLRKRDYLMLEDKLAKLYRIAFTRQQSYHLGISDNSTDATRTIRRRKRFLRNMKSPNKMRYSEKVHAINKSKIRQRFHYIIKRDTDLSTEDIGQKSNNSDLIAIQSEQYRGPGTIHKNVIPSEKIVQVLIHNVTHLTEEDLQNSESYYSDLSDSRSMRPMVNQTEIIYSVFVDGKPVLATAAATDIKLLSTEEVSSVMEKIIYMKAEPYLREPQATPLVPASKSGSVNIFTVITHNPIIIVVCSIVIILLLILFIALILMARAKRKRSAEIKRLSSRQALLSEHEHTIKPSTSKTSGRPPSPKDSDNGIENMGFITEATGPYESVGKGKDSPSIKFPHPPRSHLDSSSTSSSDSSVYIPVNQPRKSLQNILDEKASHMFETKKKSRTQSSKTNQIYATVVRKRNKKSKHKHKRKYLTENRVGSIEEENNVQGHSSNNTSVSTDSIPDTIKYDDQFTEHTEAYNTTIVGHYNRNKLLRNRVFSNKGHVDMDLVEQQHETQISPTQAINREILKALQHVDKSSESGSVGSFLSMASVKSFPKHTLPEPLHRVLEPVTLTYYDQYDESSKLPARSTKPSKADQIRNIIIHEREIKKPIPIHLPITSTQSDHPDPGVIGPIVYEIHKKRMAAQFENKENPIQDPVLTRNRFEGLLEGAIQMYSNDPKDRHSPYKEAVNTNIRSKEFRGKSAIVISDSDRMVKTNTGSRPLTAGGEKVESSPSTQPPSPNAKAWSSGAASPLVRPLSAGPFHRPEAPKVDVTRVLASKAIDKSQLSAEPLIEAIQNELKKFKRDNSQ